MFNLIPVSLLISAIGGIVYIISNHLSEFGGDDEKNDDFSFKLKARFIDWVNQLPIDNVKSQSLSLTNKMLHRLRLFLLKSDNRLTKLIGKISPHDKSVNGNGKTNRNDPDFWEDFAKKQQQKQAVTPPVESEVKIDFAVKTEAAKKFFDIKPGSESSTAPKGKNKKIVELLLPGKPVKKTLKTKKSSK